MSKLIIFILVALTKLISDPENGGTILVSVFSQFACI